MNESTDFQPTTRNPQDEVGGGLQPNASNLQPNGSDSSLSQQALPQSDSLKVQDTATGSQQSTASNSSKVLTGGTSLGLFTVAVVLVVLILLAVAKTAKPAKPAESKAPVTSNKERKGKLLQDKVIASSASKSKKNSKTKKSKKRR